MGANAYVTRWQRSASSWWQRSLLKPGWPQELGRSLTTLPTEKRCLPGYRVVVADALVPPAFACPLAVARGPAVLAVAAHQPAARVVVPGVAALPAPVVPA